MNEKLMEEFVRLGCSSSVEASITTQIYLDLCEVRRYWEVEYHFDSAMKKLFLTARKTKSEDVSTFIPVYSSDSLSINKLKQLLTLSKNKHSIYLAIINSDTTCVYYEVINGLEEPTEESVRHLKNIKQTKLDGELKRNRKILEEAAMFDIPVTIPKKKSKEQETSQAEQEEDSSSSSC